MSSRARIRNTVLPGGLDEPRRRRFAPVSAALWDISSTLGRIGVLIVIGAALLIVLSGQAKVKKRLHDALPEPVARFLSVLDATPPRTEPGERSRIADRIGETWNEIRPRTRKDDAGGRSDTARYFTVGSSTEQVLAIQGKPTSATENVWEYGQSRVYFVAGRVAGWSSSRANPLQAR